MVDHVIVFKCTVLKKKSMTFLHSDDGKGVQMRGTFPSTNEGSL